MTTKRKTYSVDALRKRVNNMLEALGSSPTVEEQAAGLCLILETVLHDTGNYKGFGWNDSTLNEFCPTVHRNRRYY